jgi:hypothetical protein
MLRSRRFINVTFCCRYRMHHGYVDRAAIADSVLMDLLTLQQV